METYCLMNGVAQSGKEDYTFKTYVFKFHHSKTIFLKLNNKNKNLKSGFKTLWGGEKRKKKTLWKRVIGNSFSLVRLGLEIE